MRQLAPNQDASCRIAFFVYNDRYILKVLVEFYKKLLITVQN
jgi:hypothetical protein